MDNEPDRGLKPLASLSEEKSPGIVGRLLVEYEQAVSTNDLVRELGESGEPEGIAVTAGRQTGGRGRGGVAWFTPKEGALCVSILLRPSRWAERITLLPLLVALCAAEAAEAVCNGARVTLKWPNDLMIDGRKLGGVLCETFGNERSLFVVAGLGLNVNFTAFDFPPDIRKRSVTLSDATGEPADRGGLLDRFLRGFDRCYGLACGGRTDALVDRVRGRMPMLGQRVEIDSNGRVIQGTAAELLPNGELAVRTDEGKRITVVSGHVRRYTAEFDNS